MKRRYLLGGALAALVLYACRRVPRFEGELDPVVEVDAASGQEGKVLKTEVEWRAQLTPEQYHVLRERGTEQPFSGRYYAHEERGAYVCAGCGNPLFSSKAKYDSGSGWPSFWEPISSTAVETEEDRSLEMTRTEVHCARCGGHLGHVFVDGPPPTGLRYCINSAALDFQPA